MNPPLQIFELVRYSGHGKSCVWRQPEVGLITNNRDQLSYPLDPDGGDNAKLAEASSDQVHEHCLLLDQDLARAMQGQSRLLICRLDGGKAHGRSADRLADGRGIQRVGLAALHIGFHVPRRHNPDVMSEPADFTRPVMRPTTRLQPNQARRKVSEKPQEVVATYLALQYGASFCIDAVHLKHVLGHIEADPHYLHRYPPVGKVVATRSPCSTRGAEGVHPISTGGTRSAPTDR
jgi:hypothetical protein